MSTVTQLEPEVLKSRIERFRQVQSEIVTQVRRVIVGQEEVLDQVMIALFVGGHCLITGLPGTAKTLLVRTMAQTLGLVFKRIQFTPDLMPSDITGTDIIEEDPTNGRRTWTYHSLKMAMLGASIRAPPGPSRRGRRTSISSAGCADSMTS